MRSYNFWLEYSKNTESKLMNKRGQITYFGLYTMIVSYIFTYFQGS